MRALVLVDLQNDFMPGGALEVPRGDEVVATANRLARAFELVVATQDWHPPNHGSFASQHRGSQPSETIELNGLDQILWPDHCVEGTPGADFHPDLNRSLLDEIIRKGTDPGVDSYSAFFDNARRRSTGLDDLLRGREVGQLYLLGLATDYCVKFSVLDAVDLGFDTSVVVDGCRGIDLRPGDAERALDAMRAAGAKIVMSDGILAGRGS